MPEGPLFGKFFIGSRKKDALVISSSIVDPMPFPGKKHVQSVFDSLIIPPMKDARERFMEYALRLAEKGTGTTSPNPRVGAVVVKSGEIVGEGWHRKAGDPHAEVIALEQSGEGARSSDLYVNLEPCCTYGRTSPCTDEIIRSGVSKVLVGSLDPNPKHSGRGIEILRAGGIDVEVGILEGKCRKLNEGYEKYITQGLPFVTVKAGMSLDGKIATRTGKSKWITGECSRERAHVMRNESDAIMVGIGTVKMDNPSLTIRCDVDEIHDPVRVVVDSRAEIDLKSNLLSTKTAVSTIIAVTQSAEEIKLEEIRSKGAEVLICQDNGGRVDSHDLMRKLAEKGIVYVLVEGGGTLIADLLENRIVDKVAFFYAPIIIGGSGAVNVVMGEGIDDIGQAIRVENIIRTDIEEDFLVEGYVKYQE